MSQYQHVKPFFCFAIARDNEVAKHAIHLQLTSSQITTHRQINTQFFFTGQVPFLLSNQC